MRTNAEFEQFVDAELRPALTEMERMRRGLRTRRIVLVIVCITLMAGAIAAAIFIPLSEKAKAVRGIFPLIAAPLPLVAAVMWRRWKRPYVKAFKERVVGAIATFCDPDATYAPEACIGSFEFARSRLFPWQATDFTGGDTLRTATLEFSIVRAKARLPVTLPGKVTYADVVFFSGLFGRIQGGPRAAHPVLILPARDARDRREARVEFKAGVLPEGLAVFADDANAAHALLTPDLLTRITAAREAAGGRLSLSFIDDSLYLAAPLAQSGLEPPLTHTLLRTPTLYAIFEQVSLPLRILGALSSAAPDPSEAASDEDA